MPVELGLVKQRQEAVLEVLAGATISDVAMRNGVTRQTVHRGLRRYAALGLVGLAGHSSRPARCPHQMGPETEVRILELREAHMPRRPRRRPKGCGRHLGQRLRQALPQKLACPSVSLAPRDARLAIREHQVRTA